MGRRSRQNMEGQGGQGCRSNLTCSCCGFTNYPFRVHCLNCGTPCGGQINTPQHPGPALNTPQLPRPGKKKKWNRKKKSKSLDQSLMEYRDLLEETHTRGGWQYWAGRHIDKPRLVQMAAWPGLSKEFFTMRPQACKKKLVGRQWREDVRDGERFPPCSINIFGEFLLSLESW